MRCSYTNVSPAGDTQPLSYSPLRSSARDVVRQHANISPPWDVLYRTQSVEEVLDDLSFHLPLET
ncbi:MAG: hypothetical protein U1U88_000167 [Lawsonella clevelandensis]